MKIQLVELIYIRDVHQQAVKHIKHVEHQHVDASNGIAVRIPNVEHITVTVQIVTQEATHVRADMIQQIFTHMDQHAVKVDGHVQQLQKHSRLIVLVKNGIVVKQEVIHVNMAVINALIHVE